MVESPETQLRHFRRALTIAQEKHARLYDEIRRLLQEEPSFLREMVPKTAQKMLEAEMDELLGAVRA